MTELDKEIERLEKKRKKLRNSLQSHENNYGRCISEYVALKITRGQTNTYVLRNHQRTFVPFSKAWNLRFAELMQAKLPRELRDMVYSHLTGTHRDGTWSSYQWYTHSLARDEKRPNIAKYKDFYSFLPPDFVGATTALEAVQNLYNTLIEEGDMVVSSDCLNVVLSDDCFNVGHLPGKELRDLGVRCTVDLYYTPRSDHASTRRCNDACAETQHVDQARLKADFHHLVSLVEHKKDFTLRIFFGVD